MEQIILSLQFIINLIGILIGGWDGLIYTLVLFIVIEVLTDVLIMINMHSLSLKVLINKSIRIILIFFLVAMGHSLDLYILKSQELLRTSIILFYLSVEGLSTLKKLETLGIPIPKKLKNILDNLKDKE